jgi:RNA polymerase sigma-70 factor, ECF subfamily
VPDRESRGTGPKPDPTPGSGVRLFNAEREESLRERLIARDEQALAELVEVATPWLLNVAQTMLRDEGEAEDVVMEAFRTLWQNVAAAAAGEGYASLMPYLLRVTRHRAIDRLRGRQRRQHKLSAAASESGDHSVPPAEPDEAGSPGWHVHTQVHSALQALPADQLAVVHLAYFEGFSQSEIAAMLEIPLGTVKTRLRLAFGRLRAVLATLQDWVV